MPELPKIVFSVSDLADFGDQYSDPEFMKDRLKVVRWTPPEPDSGKKGHWEPVPDILIDLENWKVIAPADKVTSYVVVAETTPPSVREMEPAPEATVSRLRPAIAARVVDKGTGVAVGPENRITLRVDGELVTPVIDEADPTEVTVRYEPRADLSPGSHVVTLYAEDVVENKRTATWRFTIATDPPRILSVTPGADAATALERPVLAAEVLDTGGGIDPDSVLLRLDGLRIEARFDAAGSFVLGHPPAVLAPGPHQVELLLADRGGMKTRAAWAFLVDREGPDVTRLSPVDGAALNDLGLLSAVFVDSGAGLDPYSVSLTLDGRELGRGTAGGPGYSFEPDSGLLAFTPRERLAEGRHTAVLSSRDRLGNGSQVTVTFTVDRLAPELLALSEWRPELAGPILALRLRDDGSGLPPEPPEVRIGGFRVPAGMIRDGGFARWFFRPPPEGGGREGAVSVRAADRAGNETVRTFGAATAKGPAAALARAEEAREAGKLEEAEAILREILAGDPEDLRAGNLLALVRHARGSREEATAMFAELVRRHPLAPVPRWNLALALLAGGDAAGAVREFEMYLRIDPEGDHATKAREKIEGLRGGPAKGAR
jgi:hypothetical protein